MTLGQKHTTRVCVTVIRYKINQTVNVIKTKSNSKWSRNNSKLVSVRKFVQFQEIR